MEPPARPKHLPPGLTATVGDVEEELGRAVASASGQELFDAVESVRRAMVVVREAEDREAGDEALDLAAGLLASLAPDQRADVARAYTLYLQLVNVCENAYRTHRLRVEAGAGTASEDTRSEPAARARVTFVLTAHPTESRSPDNIRLLRRIQDEVVDSLEAGRGIDRREVGHLVRLAWRVGTHPARKPSVDDEAAHLFSLLTDPVLSEWISLTDAGHELLLRTWVGGDKDGHPGVGPDQTQASLQRSRDRLLGFVRAVLLPPVAEDARLTSEDRDADGSHRELEGEDREPYGEDRDLAELDDAPDRAFSALLRALDALTQVTAGDGHRIEALRDAIDRFQATWQDRVGVTHPAIDRLSTLLRVFPALVVPLELREERGRFGAGDPIAAMMRRLAEIAEGGVLEDYARAVVVSMTLKAADLLEAQRLVDAELPTEEGVAGREGGAAVREGLAAGRGAGAVPVIPLFELPDVLERAPAILDEAWRDDRYREALRARGRLEVMLGYSDTAKRMGMLGSRVALHDAMRRIEEWARGEGIEPLFFHGHGGSVGRGGGRIEDLAATWPPGARTPYKYTVQGEMVERTFASPAILRSLVEKVATVQRDPPDYRKVHALTRELAERSQASFAKRVASEAFLTLLARATPYTRLQTLTIGSRPSSRADGSDGGSGGSDGRGTDGGGDGQPGGGDGRPGGGAGTPGGSDGRDVDAGLEKLRAIPWVLCWTQTRLLLHAWLGIGQAWREVRDQPGIDEALAAARADDPLFRSYARLLSFTMAKTAPRIWHRYRGRLAPDYPADEVAELDADFEAAIDLACRAVGADSLLPDRPWLEESIRYRAPMIHPLNLLQIDLLERPEWNEDEVRLFRETVTGIAAGMLTTG